MCVAAVYQRYSQFHVVRNALIQNAELKHQIEWTHKNSPKIWGERTVCMKYPYLEYCAAAAAAVATIHAEVGKRRSARIVQKVSNREHSLTVPTMIVRQSMKSDGPHGLTIEYSEPALSCPNGSTKVFYIFALMKRAHIISHMCLGQLCVCLLLWFRCVCVFWWFPME